MAYNYIITSDDFSAALDKIEELKNSFNKNFEESSYDLEESGLYEIIDDFTTVSLFDDIKFMVLKSCESLFQASASILNQLLGAMNNANSENVMVLLFMKDIPQNNLEVFSKIKKYASVIDVRIKNMPLDQYVDKDLLTNSYQIDSDAKSLLLSYCDSLANLKQSLEILKCYKADEKLIKACDVKKMLAQPLEDNVYQLIEAVLKQDRKRVFKAYQDLKLISVQPSYLVSMLITKFQEIYNVAVLCKSGTSQNEISELFHTSVGRAYYMMKNAKENKLKDIEENLRLLNDLDFQIKTGIIDQSIGLELYLLK